MSSPVHVVVVGALIRNSEGQVLLIRHPKRGWEIPQGRVEQGEGLIDALHREVLEEAGIQVCVGPLAAVYSKISSPEAVIFNFLADYRAGDLQTSEESLEVAWHDPDQALSLVSHPVNNDRLQTLLAYDGATCFRAYSTSPFTLHTSSAIAP